jgi:hypothetical protein
MTKHSRSERARRAAETTRLKEVEAAWMGSLSAETAKAFKVSVAAARARGPRERQPDMAPGTAPNPPRPGREPRPSKDDERRRPRRD